MSWLALLLLAALGSALVAGFSRGSDCGHGGDLLAQLRQQLVCCSCRASILRWRFFKVIAHLAVRAESGQGAGGPALGGIAAARQRMPGQWPGPCRGAPGCWALTRMTSSGVSWNTRLKPWGAQSARSAPRRCTATETSQRQLQGAERAEEGGGVSRRRIIGAGGGGCRLRSTSTAMAMGPATASSVALRHRPGRVVAGVVRVVQALDHRAVNVQA